VPEGKRCTAHKRKTKEPCRNAAVTGATVCRMHGGASPAVKIKAARVKAEAKAAELLTKEFARRGELIPPDDPEANGAVALEAEIRRTVGWSRFLESKINSLASDEDLVFGGVAVERKDGFGADSYVLERREARLNEWVRLLNVNREHLRKLGQIWVSAGLDVKRIAIAEREVDLLEQALNGILSEAGVNPNSPEIRKIIFKHLSALPS
jgi:hypothetical protein